MDPEIHQQAQGDRLVRYLVETGFLHRDADGGFHVVDGAPVPNLTVICDRRGRVIPGTQDYISAIAYVESNATVTQLPSAV
jgi:hypothetical protein